MAIRIRGGRIIDPSRSLDETGDIFIIGDTIVDGGPASSDWETIEASGLWVAPGLIDAHVHLREPGEEHKEDIESGLKAAAAGGFTAVLPMPNTKPPNDSVEITRHMINRARKLDGTQVFPVAAVTQGRRGKELAPMGELKQSGAVAFSDDGNAVLADDVMERALKACRKLGVPLCQHAEDPSISKGGVIHNGDVAKKLGLPGWSSEAEAKIVARDIALAEKTGARLHICHISTKESVALLQKAKSQGIDVTAEVTPHHLCATDSIALTAGALAKVNPPLRPIEHVNALREALADGTIDIVATDHAPHAKQDKGKDFIKAAFGMVGLEIAVPLLLILIKDRALTPLRMIDAMSTRPARLFGIPGGTLAPGSRADLTLIAPNDPFTVNPDIFRSKGRNTPFAGKEVPGRPVRTILKGVTIYNFSD
jgi:dihydroorotase